MSKREKPRAFRMPISRVRSMTIVCMLSKTTIKLMTMPRATIVRVKGRSCGKLEEFMRETYSARERMLYWGNNFASCARVASVSPLLRT